MGRSASVSLLLAALLVLWRAPEVVLEQALPLLLGGRAVEPVPAVAALARRLEDQLGAVRARLHRTLVLRRGRLLVLAAGLTFFE